MEELMEACKYGKVEAVKRLLRDYPSININHTDEVKYFVDFGY
jgi:hypothetical protein